MTAIDELKRLLDERGEFYKIRGDKTLWGRPIDAQTGDPFGVFHNQAQPMGEDRLFVEMQLVTPEQAIAATLGRTTTRNTKRAVYGEPRPVCEVCGYGIGDKRWHYCPKCGSRILEGSE